MTTRRTLSVASATVLLLAALTACFPTLPGMPTNPGGGGGSDEATLTGTWSGTDSDNDEWELEFQDDNTLGVSFNGGGPKDDATDTWELSGSALSLVVGGFEDGNITCDGTFDGGTSISLACSYAGRPFTLPLTQD